MKKDGGLKSSHFYPFRLRPFFCEFTFAIRSAILSVLKSWGKALGWRPIDIANAVQSPRKVRAVPSTYRPQGAAERAVGGSVLCRHPHLSAPLSLTALSHPSLLQVAYLEDTVSRMEQVHPEPYPTQCFCHSLV